MRMRSPATALFAATLAFCSVGCRKHENGAVIGQAAASSQPPPKPPAPASGSGVGGGASAGAGEDEDGNPQGGKKWRDTGVYVDGQPVGVLSFGELPIALKPVWIEEEHSVEFGPDDKGPRVAIVPERFYRFIDYLKAVGVDVAKVKELHVMGPKLSEVIITSGKELRSKKGREFMFRFGTGAGGKAIPQVPMNFANMVKPDKVSAVMVYIDKKPPVLLPEEEGLALDGKAINDIPYFGEPLRGGVRVYQDDRLRLTIKRPMLRETTPLPSTDGKQRYRLWTLLQSHGVDTDKVVEAWMIADERRKQKLTRAELEQLTFEVGAKEKNEILVGDGKLRVNAIALHAHALKDSELPKIRPQEE